MRDLAIYGLTLITHGIAFLLGVCVRAINTDNTREIRDAVRDDHSGDSPR